VITFCRFPSINKRTFSTLTKTD